MLIKFLPILKRKIMQQRTLNVMAVIAFATVSAAAYAQTTIIQSNTIDKLPPSLYDGYWAMQHSVGDDQYNVINFYLKQNKLYSDNYTFLCHADGTYEHIHTQTSQLIPDKGVFRLGSDSQTHLNLLSIKPKTGLIILQTFEDKVLSEAFLGGLVFVYEYQKNPQPLCP